jgi:alpha-1,3/alpha-1,6-mannosyltransferase
VILANSKFSSRVYAAAFPSLAKRPPRVVYPCIDIDAYQGSSVLKGKGKTTPGDGVDLVAS